MTSIALKAQFPHSASFETWLFKILILPNTCKTLDARTSIEKRFCLLVSCLIIYLFTRRMSVPTYASTIDQCRLAFQQRLATQQIRPFIVSVDVLGYLILIACLLLQRHLPFTSASMSQSMLFIVIVALSLSSLQTTRTLGLAYGVMVGISSSWCIALSASLLLVHKPARDFRRITLCHQDDKSRNGDESHLQWQGIPESTLERLFWILDLLGSLRALHWDYVHPQYRISSASLKTRPEDRTSIQTKLAKLLVLYLCIDALKEIIAMDPYFWGYIDHAPPAYIKALLPLPSLVQAYRMLVAFAVLYIGIEFTSTIGILIFVDVLGPSLAGTWGHNWAWRPQFGDFDSIFTRGLRGWWGAWWHQMFRVTLTSLTMAIIHRLHLPKTGAVSKPLRLMIPFLLSGAIHASGSYTMWGDTRPMNSFLFFVLQPLGIGVQSTGSSSLHKMGLMGRVPRLVRRITNFAFTVTWLLYTFQLLADDFARGGLWLTEPFPISVLQTLRLGSKARAH